ncbi:MAG: VTT domain-containing protein [Lachnospiraceae bacterium]
MKKVSLRDYIIVFFVIICSVVVFLYRKELGAIGGLGYLGVFILCLLSNITIFLPAPSLMVVVSYSQVFSPILVAVIGALGTTVGELSGYIFGDAITNLSVRWQVLIKKISKKITNVNILVFVLALLPLPLFDFVGVYAGSKKVKLSLFIIACYIGKLIKMLFYTVFVGGAILKYITI